MALIKQCEFGEPLSESIPSQARIKIMYNMLEGVETILLGVDPSGSKRTDNNTGCCMI